MTVEHNSPTPGIPPTPVDDVRGTHTHWWEALTAADVPVLDTVLADDLTFHSPYGTVSPKADILENLRVGRLKYDTITDMDPLIRVHGQTAIVTGRVDIHFQWERHPILERLYYTAVYGWTAPHWRMLAYQSTPRTDDEG